jgi:hypothetical protein
MTYTSKGHYKMEKNGCQTILFYNFPFQFYCWCDLKIAWSPFYLLPYDITLFTQVLLFPKYFPNKDHYMLTLSVPYLMQITVMYSYFISDDIFSLSCTAIWSSVHTQDYI